MKSLNWLIFTSILLNLAYSWFCSAYCKPNMCTGTAKTQCTDCDSPFLISSGNCNIDATSTWFVAADSSNITAVPSSPGSCSVYNFLGPVDSSVAFQLTHTGPISIPHMKIRLILWIIMYDQWKVATDYIQHKLLSTNQLFNANVSIHQTQEPLCSTPAKNQWYMKTDYIFTHTDTTNPVVLVITAKQTGTVLKWGIKEYIILASGCHPYCFACTDALSTTCSSCRAGYKLSGTTCAVNCLSLYGLTTNTTLCVFCDPKCAVCFETSTNCSSCTPSGANQAFLLGTQCVNPCPAGYATDTVLHECKLCTNPACLSCSYINVSVCYQCNTTTYWYQSDCYNPCPQYTFLNANGVNCTSCDISCAVCTNTPTPCSSCRTGYKLSGTTCALNCLSLYGQTTNTSICVLCDPKCAVCFETSTNCSSCTPSGANQAFLLGTQCVNPCPVGYATDTVLHECKLCTNPACLSCSYINVSLCYQCNTTTYWYQSDCYNPCPQYTFLNANGVNCTDCDISCAVCTNTPTPCSSCRTGYKLSGTTCAVNCLPLYGQTTNTSICVLCDPKCAVCFETPTNCSSCTVSGPDEAFLNGNQCVNPCPTGLTPDPSNHMCQLCHNPACTTCNATDFTICYICNSTTYWFQSDCLQNCPPGYYPSGSNCTQCDVSCLTCTGSPSPCSTCNVSYYFYSNACYSTCPSGYFAHPPSQLCLLCATDCVTATIKMSFASTKQLHIDITFSRNIQFSTFPYQTFQSINISDASVTLTDFVITYEITSSNSYRIILKPTSDSFVMTDVLFTVDINNNYSSPFYSQDMYQFSPLIYDLTDNIIWTIPVQDTWDLKTLEQINDQINTFFNQQIVQQIKKTGVFAFLLPGAQLCSTIILHNATPPRSMYEGARFWGSFIYFEVPQWEKNGTELKYFFSELVSSVFNSQQNKVQRLLVGSYDQQGVDWRFSRTGHTGYFLLDCYIPIIMIAISWIPIFVISRFNSTSLRVRKIKGYCYTFLHRIHQISMFYILLAMSLEWTYFGSHSVSAYKYISFAFSFVLLFYCLVYQIHVFYKIIPYTHTDIGSTKYNFYVQTYSYFLRDIRYEQYGLYTRWESSHFLRPYNFQILSFIRLALILASLPLFQSITYGCISSLLVIQFLEIIRFLLSWPYYSNWRNFYKLGLEFVLFIIFALYLASDVLYRQGQLSTNMEIVSQYEAIGWAGFIMLFIYNILYFFYLCIDISVGCMYTNRQRMEYARNCYYKELLQEYETYQEIQNPTMKQSDVQSFFTSNASRKNKYLHLLSNLHKAEPAIELGSMKTQKQTIEMMAHKGNLCEHDYEKFWKVKIKIEQYEIRQLSDSKYSINYCKVKDLYMHLHPDMNRKYNILMPERRIKEVKITALQNEFYFNLVDNIYKHYQTNDTEVVIIKTYLKIDQNIYKPGEKIQIKKEDMSQQIEMRQHGGYVEKEKLLAVLRGFPVPDDLLLLL